MVRTTWLTTLALLFLVAPATIYSQDFRSENRTQIESVRAPSAQQPATHIPLRSPPAPFREFESSLRQPLVRVAWGHPDDHRWEGFLVGAGVTGLLVGMVVHGLCRDGSVDRSCWKPFVSGAVFGGVAGGVVGGFIGRGIPKKKK